MFISRVSHNILGSVELILEIVCLNIKRQSAVDGEEHKQEQTTFLKSIGGKKDRLNSVVQQKKGNPTEGRQGTIRGHIVYITTMKPKLLSSYNGCDVVVLSGFTMHLYSLSVYMHCIQKARFVVTQLLLATATLQTIVLQFQPQKPTTLQHLAGQAIMTADLKLTAVEALVGQLEEI